MPSNKVLEEKKLVVENLAQKMKTAQAGVLVMMKLFTQGIYDNISLIDNA